MDWELGRGRRLKTVMMTRGNESVKKGRFRKSQASAVYSLNRFGQLIVDMIEPM